MILLVCLHGQRRDPGADTAVRHVRTRRERGAGVTSLRTGGRELGVVMFVRAGTLAGPVEEAVERLRRLDAEEVVDDVTVRGWPDEVLLGAGDTDSETVEAYERFVAWAAREDSSIAPAFDVRTQHSRLTGESGEVLRTPVMCLAVYEGDRLAAVFPHVDREGCHTVPDAVDALAAGEFEEITGDRPVGVDEGICPACGTGVVNVQGLVACPECDWVAHRPSHRETRRQRRISAFRGTP